MQTENRAIRVTADIKVPELVLGRKARRLHIYTAFKEDRFYVSAAPHVRAARPRPDQK